ncbi:MAG: Ditrans,polycis-undecaprenyl-diphosphate synthase ((2E,6E)-farnesyl-diphosphate specific) [Gemmatimonadaceae bacterium]|nr:Ditrans,polycis-undecaprenyl-diphosphate synthase ((2E,6E)-farnesyl-diphosphate specific) [Gemmatimonadaceae bacterium]
MDIGSRTAVVAGGAARQGRELPCAGDPAHVAIIMDGNGRWAQKRGRPRTAGHIAGAKAVRRAIEFARRRGVRVLTLYSFSADNWARPQEEIQSLMMLFRRYLASEVPRCVEHDIRLTVIGRRDRLAPDLVRAIEAAEAATGRCRALQLRLAVDYSAREAIVAAADALRDGEPVTRASLSRAMAEAIHDHAGTPDVDLLIRTGGEQRISDFLLWESAYAELVFLRCLWPDFGAEDFETAIAEFGGRERRFGGLRAASAG